jgi:hypothetical protein
MGPHEAQHALTPDCQAAMGQTGPWNGVAAKTTRIASSSSPSLTRVFGPRLPEGGAVDGGAVAAYTLERGRR